MDCGKQPPVKSSPPPSRREFVVRVASAAAGVGSQEGLETYTWLTSLNAQRENENVKSASSRSFVAAIAKSLIAINLRMPRAWRLLPSAKIFDPAP
jgi:hypothetical protein